MHVMQQLQLKFHFTRTDLDFIERVSVAELGKIVSDLDLLWRERKLVKRGPVGDFGRCHR
jgi:hypothetical protein